jgi:hypothetical protein
MLYEVGIMIPRGLKVSRHAWQAAWISSVPLARESQDKLAWLNVLLWCALTTTMYSRIARKTYVKVRGEIVRQGQFLACGIYVR